MDVTYFAVRSFDDYQPGDIIPGAGSWPAIQMHVAEGRVAPVLVATLPKAMQSNIAAWEKEVEASQEASRAKAEEQLAARQAARTAAKAEAAKTLEPKKEVPAPAPEPEPEAVEPEEADEAEEAPAEDDE